MNRTRNQTCDWGTEDPSNNPFDDSDFAVALADSDNAGHECASMTDRTSEAAPLEEGLFQAGLLAALSLRSPPLSELSAAELESSTGEATEGKVSASGGGDEGAAATGSDSPRTTWFHGEETGSRAARRDWWLSEEWRGEWLPVMAIR